MKLRLIQSFTLLSILLSSCTTYYIPIESFKRQYSNLDKASLKTVKIIVGSSMDEYQTYPIDTVRCKDKDGNDIKLQISPSIETRITTNDGKKYIFYLDRVYLENDTLHGYRSRFLGLPKKIPMENIKKIEVQDGKKYFKYVD